MALRRIAWGALDTRRRAHPLSRSIIAGVQIRGISCTPFLSASILSTDSNKPRYRAPVRKMPETGRRGEHQITEKKHAHIITSIWLPSMR